MLIKLAGAAIIIGAAAFLGFNMSKKLKLREDNLKAFHSALVMLESEITFSENSIDIALKNISAAVGLSEFFEYVIRILKGNGARFAWSKGIEKYKDKLCLEERDVKILLTISGELGITNKENQIKNIRYVLTMLSNAEEEAHEKYSVLSGLYKKISLGAGIAAAILLM